MADQPPATARSDILLYVKSGGAHDTTPAACSCVHPAGRSQTGHPGAGWPDHGRQVSTNGTVVNTASGRCLDVVGQGAANGCSNRIGCHRPTPMAPLYADGETSAEDASTGSALVPACSPTAGDGDGDGASDSNDSGC